MINQKRLLEEFVSLVRIDAPSYEERIMCDTLKERLTSLGFSVEEDDACKHYNSQCGNLYGFLKGTLEGPPLLFSAHMDTVEPSKGKIPVIHDDGTITSDGTTVLGADDISGVAAILEAVRCLQENQIPHRDIEILFTIAEEVYLLGSAVFDYSKIRSREAYTLDMSGDIGTMAYAAPSVIFINARIIGKASHAGFAPEKGINAIQIASTAVSRLKLGQIDAQTTANIGRIEGGLATNIIPDQCTVLGEVRGFNHDQAMTCANTIKQTFETAAAEMNAASDVQLDVKCQAYQLPPDTPVIKHFQTACKAAGLPYNPVKTFGGSDNNHFALNQIPGVVIACGMNQVHSCQEYTTLNQLTDTANLTLHLMQTPAK